MVVWLRFMIWIWIWWMIWYDEWYDMIRFDHRIISVYIMFVHTLKLLKPNTDAVDIDYMFHMQYKYTDMDMDNMDTDVMVAYYHVYFACWILILDHQNTILSYNWIRLYLIESYQIISGELGPVYCCRWILQNKGLACWQLATPTTSKCLYYSDLDETESDCWNAKLQNRALTAVDVSCSYAFHHPAFEHTGSVAYQVSRSEYIKVFD